MDRTSFFQVIASGLLVSMAPYKTKPKNSSPVKKNSEGNPSLEKFFQEQNVCSSVSELQQLNTRVLSSRYALVLGYYEPGDRGGGVFVWDADHGSAANGGTIIRPNALPASHKGRWKRLFDSNLTVFSFGAKAQKGVDSTKAFQEMSDALGYVSIPKTEIPFEVQSVQPKRPTRFFPTTENAFIKMRATDKRDAAFKITNPNSKILKGIHIDANYTSRSCVSIQADNCSCTINAENVTADNESSKYVSALWVNGNECNFNVSGKNFKNTGNSNKSVPRIVTVQGTSDRYKGTVNGHNIQCGLTIGSRTGSGSVPSVEVKNAADNGVYQLGGNCEFDTIIYNGNEEAFVGGGEATINRLKVNSSGTSPISLNNNKKLNIRSLQIKPGNTDGYRCLIRTRKGKKGGKINIESVQGTVRGGVLIGMGNSGGMVEELVIRRARLTYEYDPKTTGRLSRWIDMEAVQRFDLKNISVNIIDLKNKLTSKDTFYLRLPTSKLRKKSHLKDINIKMLKSDGQSPSLGQCKIANANQAKIECSGLDI